MISPNLHESVKSLAAITSRDSEPSLIASQISLVVRRLSKEVSAELPNLSTILDYLGEQIQSQTLAAMRRHDLLRKESDSIKRERQPVAVKG